MKDEHPPRAQAIETIARQWQKSTILNPAMLDQLYEINRIYLNMLAMGKEAWIGDRPNIAAPDPVTLSLMALDPVHSAEAARCPFSLFNAKFQNGAFWFSLASSGTVREAVMSFGEEKRSGSAAFTEMALFYAWHLVRSHPLAAQLLLGMKNQTLTVFKQLSIVKLRQLAEEHPDVITPRWPERTRFWQIMLSAVQQGTQERIAELRLLGIQMIAAELAAPAVPEVRTRPPASPATQQ